MGLTEEVEVVFNKKQYYEFRDFVAKNEEMSADSIMFSEHEEDIKLALFLTTLGLIKYVKIDKNDDYHVLFVDKETRNMLLQLN